MPEGEVSSLDLSAYMCYICENRVRRPRMTDKDDILQLISAAIDEANLQRPSDSQLACSGETVLAGQGAVLDSLALMVFILAVEQKVQAAFGSSVVLADENTLSNLEALCGTVDKLTDHVLSLTDRVADA